MSRSRASAESLRLLVIMDPLIPVPPRHYGGIERVVADLCEGLAKRGHEVAFWGAPGSHVPGVVEPFGNEGEWTTWSNVRNTSVVSSRLLRSLGGFDLVHNFGRLFYLVSAFRRNIPKVQTYMRPVNPDNMRKAARMGAKRMHYTAVSKAIRDTGIPGGGDWSVIYNCASASDYRFEPATDPNTAPLMFLGRLERCKGAHTAIQVARKLGRRLIIAGNISNIPREIEYFHAEIEPFIDGDLIDYVGPVDNEQKNKLLGSSAALLVPIEWEEPFPVILPEALLCGTPLIAFQLGGVPEGIDHGRTGFLCDTPDEMAEFVNRLGEIDRRECRAEAERRFDVDVIVGEYENLYRSLIGAQR